MQMYNYPRRATTPRRTTSGRWLYQERLRRNMRQSDVAAYLGCNGGRISEWEQGIHPIPPDVMTMLQRPQWT